jgi:hypothetical protein
MFQRLHIGLVLAGGIERREEGEEERGWKVSASRRQRNKEEAKDVDVYNDNDETRGKGEMKVEGGYVPVVTGTCKWGMSCALTMPSMKKQWPSPRTQPQASEKLGSP